MKHFYLLTVKLTLDVNNWRYFVEEWKYFINGWFIGNLEYLNTCLEQYTVVYPDGVSGHITKDDFGGRCSGYSCVSKLFKEI